MQLGVCYYPEQWDPSLWRQDAKAMAAMGIRIVRIAEFAWSKMEPRPGEYDWAWLDEAIAILAGEGLKLVLGTPTAAPPRWLIDAHPEILARDAQGRERGFGSRRHYCFSSDVYLDACRSIVRAMAARYGQHPEVIAWQTDNEYGCHDTVLSYSDCALRRFRLWLAERYGSIKTLNERWGNVFWSMDYASFDEIGFPVSIPTMPNPIHALDFRRFASDEVKRFNRVQCEILREHSPGRDIIHNFMGFFAEFEHYELAADLDVASWDNYPLGLNDMVRFVPETERRRWMRSGHPDISAFHHDLYRGMCKGRWWIMEQQSGPVNWADANPAPLPGMVRTWTWEAFAHGAEVVSYFRWRQVPYAQEQMHSGLNTSDNRIDVGGQEAAQVAREVAALGRVPVTQQARVALVMDYASKWHVDIQPHGLAASYYGQTFAYYSALRRLGLDVDILPASADFSGYAMVVVPMLTVVDSDVLKRLDASGARVVFGPRSGAKTIDFALPPNLPPGPLAELLPIRVTRVESLPADVVLPVKGRAGLIGEVSIWREFVDAGDGVETYAWFGDDLPAAVRKGRFEYHAGQFSADLLCSLLRESANTAGVETRLLPGALRLRRRGDIQFAVNYGPETVELPVSPDTAFLLGERTLAPASVAAWLSADKAILA